MDQPPRRITPDADRKASTISSCPWVRSRLHVQVFVLDLESGHRRFRVQFAVGPEERLGNPDRSRLEPRGKDWIFTR